MICRYKKSFKAFSLVHPKFPTYTTHVSLLNHYTYPLFHLLNHQQQFPPSIYSNYHKPMAATASSTTVVRATPFLGQTRSSSLNPLRDVVSMPSAKFTMVIFFLLKILFFNGYILRSLSY